jgi:hypothetical protein
MYTNEQYRERAEAVLGDYIHSVPREQQEDRGKIRTFTGRYVNPLAVRARDICMEDIAHHLSIINRYTGASPWPMSVAQHSVLCAERAAKQWDRTGIYSAADDFQIAIGGTGKLTLFINDGSVGTPGLMFNSDAKGPWSRRDWIAAHLLHDAGEYLFNDLASPVKRDPRMAWYRQQEHQTTRLIFATFGVPVDLLELTKPLDDDMFFAEARSFWAGSDEVTCWEAWQAEARFHGLARELQLRHIIHDNEDIP